MRRSFLANKIDRVSQSSPLSPFPPLFLVGFIGDVKDVDSCSRECRTLALYPFCVRVPLANGSSFLITRVFDTFHLSLSFYFLFARLERLPPFLRGPIFSSPSRLRFNQNGASSALECFITTRLSRLFDSSIKTFNAFHLLYRRRLLSMGHLIFLVFFFFN